MRHDLSRLLAQPIAHRGLHACGAEGAVENSVSAARAAIASGYGIECDVQLSRDGEAIVFHDDVLARLTGAAGRLADQDAAALTRLVLRGSSDHVPTLAAFLTAIDGRAPLVIELKSSGDGDIRIADRTLAIIEAYAGPVAIESFDPILVLHCRNRSQFRPIGLVGPAENGTTSDPGVAAACDFLSWSIDDLARIAERYPLLPRTTWTVRTSAQAALAKRHDAQIVFEGLAPPSINSASKKSGNATS